MNDAFRFFTLVRGAARRRACWLATGLALVVGAAGCADRAAVTVRLQARSMPERSLARQEIQAQVTGPLSGLRYRWLSVSGECDPQESDLPTTIFRFAEGVMRDHLTVEVLRDGQRVAQADLDVHYEAAELLRQGAQALPAVAISIAAAPPWEAGGADTRADIGGRVTGEFSTDFRVVIYARAYDSWFIQPAAQALHPVQADGAWSTWTHTGEVYAALLVRPGYAPLPRVDMLPPVGGDVLARTIIEGQRK